MNPRIRVDRMDRETATMVTEIASRTGLTRVAILRRAVSHWGPRVLSGEISLVAEQPIDLSGFVQAASERTPRVRRIGSPKRASRA